MTDIDLKGEMDATIINHMTNLKDKGVVIVKGHGSLAELVQMVNLYEQGDTEAVKALILKHAAIGMESIRSMTRDMEHPVGKAMLQTVEAAADKQLKQAASAFELPIPDVRKLPKVDEYAVSLYEENQKKPAKKKTKTAK